ncbi:SDR family NAD(P)-dependent oxidoreductase [Novosphingobium rosa]|uniref:SDR family NAD(P)-dependent oxidoreductase n=1 Tax=Novosphingobium rosa TaxID=76978 RepID=UPI000830B444|nr:SDR family oxidoreductase [Novosphingobium rosa]
MNGRLDGKIAVVTGIGAGIGKGCALHFAREGAMVYGCDIDLDAARATVDEAGAGSIHARRVDLTREDEVADWFTAIAREVQGIDALINAAAAAIFAPVETMRYHDWTFTLKAELDNVFLCCRAAWPLLKERGGAIVNFASANAYVTLPGSYAAAHCAGKGGVLALTRQLAAEGAPHGIRANSISPGPILTAATRDVFLAPEMNATVLRGLMIKRLGQPEDIARAALFLASCEASFITAADLRVDGGATAL